MNFLFLSESDVASLVNIHDALDSLEECFRDWPRSGKSNLLRSRARQAHGPFNLLGASYELRKVFGMKAYFGTPDGTRFQVMLYSSDTGDLIAIIEADYLGQLRTGAASGIATKLLARQDSSVLGVIGTGRQARSQIDAVAAVRSLKTIRVFSRDCVLRTAFAKAIERDLGIETIPTDSAQECVENADIVVTITKSPEPVFDGAWIANGTHINTAGANSESRREIDRTIVQKANLLTVDSLAQAKLEAGEYITGVANGDITWNEIRELGTIAAGLVPARKTAEDITLFKSLGIGLEDVAFAERIYRRAVEEGVGRRMTS